MLDKLKAVISGLLEKRDAAAAAFDTKRGEVEAFIAKLTDEKGEKRNPTAEEKSEFDTLLAQAQATKDELAEINAELKDRQEELDTEERAIALRQRIGVVVGDEPLTYARGNGNSYLRDLARANVPGGGNTEAQARLARHGQEIRAANMNRTDGTGGEFVPPLWLMEEFVALARAGRITADLCRRVPLPPGTDSLNLPKVATGSAAAEQADAGVVQKTDMTTGSASGAVTTIAGQQVFAMQLLDQSPINFDEVVFQDLLADLAKQIDIYVLNKAAIGILNVTGIVSVSYTDATPTVPELYPKVADMTQQIQTNRFLAPQALVMHPRRWAWILAALDSSNRPLVVPNPQGPTNAFAGMTDVRAEGSTGNMQGLPVYVDPNVPTNLGAGTNEDVVIGARFDDLFLFEGDVRTRALFETDANTLEVRLQVWEYIAFIGSRYPKAIGKITGTGLITPTF
jgi:HK97 family phage major capsid protein